jgi:AbrB family looped-hinge helix DNA binding protein
MESVKISPKYQVVIPRRVRESLKLKPGQKVQVIEYGNRIELVPERRVSEMRGFLKGIRTEIDRETDRV